VPATVGRPRLVPAALVDTWVRRYTAGETAAQVAADGPHCPATVCRHLRMRGVTLRPPGRATVSAAAASEMVALYTTGLSIMQVAVRTGYAAATVRRHLLAGGVTLAPRGGGSHRGPEATPC
jgi:hypothetical protein